MKGKCFTGCPPRGQPPTHTHPQENRKDVVLLHFAELHRGTERPHHLTIQPTVSKGRLCPSRKQVPVPRAPQAAWTQGDILSPGDPAEPMPAEAGGAGPAPAAGPGSGNGGSKGPLASAPPAQSRRYCRAPRAPAPGPGPGSLQSPRALGAPQSGQRSRPASSRPSPVGPVQQQRQKYRSMEQNRKPRDKSTHIWTPYLRQRRQEYTMD